MCTWFYIASISVTLKYLNIFISIIKSPSISPISIDDMPGHLLVKMYYRSHSSTYYHANKPTKAAVNNETRIPDNSIIGTYLDTKSDVFYQQFLSMYR